MKTGTPLHSSSALSAQLLPSRPALRVRTGQANALPQLSFKALFADIKPGAFEEMSKKALAFRDEQARLDKARRQQKPREQDQLPAAVQPPAQPASTIERARKSAPERAMARQSDRVNERQAAARTERTHAAASKTAVDAPRPSQSGSSDEQAAHVAQDVPNTKGAEQASSTADRRAAPAHGRDPQHAAESAKSPVTEASASTDDTGTKDLPQAVADALTYIEAQHAREHELAKHTTQAQAQPAQTTAAPAAETAADATPAEVQPTSGEKATDATLNLAQATATKAGDVSSSAATAEALDSTTDSEMPQAVTGMAGGHDSANAKTGQGKKGQSGQTAQPMMTMAHTAAAKLNGTANAAPSSAPMNAASQGSTPAATSNPAALSSDTSSLTAMSTTGRAEGMPAGVGLAMPLQGSHSPTRADGSPLISSRIDAGIQTQEFKEQFAKQVAGLMVQGQDRAEIRLTPAELGPIRIRVSLSAEEAQLDISAAHAATRTAIEASMSTLRQMLSEQGIRLADYRMDNGQNAVFAQNRQTGQDLSSNTQQNGTAFGQGGDGSQGGRESSAARSTAGAATSGSGGSMADMGQTGGRRRGPATTGNGRVDLFA